MAVAVEYVGVIAILCLFAGAFVGWQMAPKAQDTQAEAKRELSQIDNIHDGDALAQVGNRAYDNVHAWLSVAISAYEKSIPLKPNDPNTMTDLAAMYVSAANPLRAVELTRQAAALDPKHAQSRYWLGVSLAQTGDKEGARKALSEVKNLDPTSDLAKEADKRLAELR